MILLGFRYLSSSIPIIVFAGVAVGVGLIFSFLLQSMARNPLISNSLVRWAFIGFSLCEVSGFIGLVYSFLLSYALSYLAPLNISLNTSLNISLSIALLSIILLSIELYLALSFAHYFT